MDYRIVKGNNWMTTKAFAEKYHLTVDAIHVDNHYSKNPFKYKKVLDRGKNREVLLINETYILRIIDFYIRMQHEAQIFYYVFSKQFNQIELTDLIFEVEKDNNTIGTKKAWWQFFTNELFRVLSYNDISSLERANILSPQISTKTYIFWRVARWLLIKGAKKKGKKFNFKELEDWLYKE